MDPRFFILGIIADLKENIVNINDKQKEEIFSAAALTVFKNVTNKTYLRGISDALDLISSPTENKFNVFFGGVVGNSIPYTGLRRQGIPGITEPDQIAYEARGFMDRILSTIGLGEKYLEPKRDLLTGEPIEKTPNALYINPDGIASFSFWFQGPSLVGRKVDVKENRVLLEITSLKIPLEEPSKVKYKTIDFTQIFNKDSKQSAYDYWTENIGKIKDSSGDTLMQKLEKEINSRDYKLREEGDVNFDGGKEMVIKKVFKAYKDAAYAQMIKNYPEVKDAIIKAQKQKYELLGKSKEGESDQINVLLPQ